MPARLPPSDVSSTCVTMHVPYLVSIVSPSWGARPSSRSWTSFQFGASITTENLSTGRSSHAPAGGRGADYDAAVTGDTGKNGALGLLFRIYTAGEACETLVDETVDPHGVADGFVTMSLLSVEGSLTPTEISRRLGMRLTTTSALVRRLVERGHARQVPNPNDGRSQLVTLTDEGAEALAAAFPAFRETIEEVESHLTRSREDVRAALDDLEQAFRTVRARRLERARIALS